MTSPLQYIRSNPDFKITLFNQLRSGNGIQTIVDIDDKRISWNGLNTAAVRNHFNSQSSVDFFKWLKPYMIKRIEKETAEWGTIVVNCNIRFTR